MPFRGRLITTSSLSLSTVAAPPHIILPTTIASPPLPSLLGGVAVASFLAAMRADLAVEVGICSRGASSSSSRPPPLPGRPATPKARADGWPDSACPFHALPLACLPPRVTACGGSRRSSASASPCTSPGQLSSSDGRLAATPSGDMRCWNDPLLSPDGFRAATPIGDRCWLNDPLLSSDGCRAAAPSGDCCCRWWGAPTVGLVCQDDIPPPKRGVPGGDTSTIGLDLLPSPELTGEISAIDVSTAPWDPLHSPDLDLGGVVVVVVAISAALGGVAVADAGWLMYAEDGAPFAMFPATVSSQLLDPCVPLEKPAPFSRRGLLLGLLSQKPDTPSFSVPGEITGEARRARLHGSGIGG